MEVDNIEEILEEAKEIPTSRKRRRTTTTSSDNQDKPKPWLRNFKSLSVYPSRKHPGKIFMYGRGRYGYGRNRQYMRGSGRYGAPWLGQRLGSATGAVIGNWLAPGIGATAGSDIGGNVGRMLGKGFRAVTGWGDYAVHENSLLFPEVQVPSFGEDSIRVKKREFIGTINSSEDFKNLFLPINPGLDVSFPWLAQIATNYEQYRWNGLIFQFVTTCSDFSAQVGIGQVMMASDYNAADPAFINTQQMLGTMFSTSAKPSQSILHAVECAPQDTASKLYYVRSGNNPSGTDIRLYDMLSFQIATQGIPSPQTPYVPTPIGQLWVSYDITLTKSVQNNTVGYSLNTDIWDGTRMGNLFDPEYWVLKNGSNIGTHISGDSTNGLILTFPNLMESGYYNIQIWLKSRNSTQHTTDWDTICTGCTELVNYQAPAGSDNASETAFTTTIKINTINATVNLIPVGWTDTVPLHAHIEICQINGELYQ